MYKSIFYWTSFVIGFGALLIGLALSLPILLITTIIAFLAVGKQMHNYWGLEIDFDWITILCAISTPLCVFAYQLITTYIVV